MSKKVKIILLAVVVLALAGTLYFLNADINTNKNQVVLEIAETEVNKITFKTFYSREAVITKENDLWKCEDVYLKDVFKDDIFNSISAIRAIKEIKAYDDLKAYGLDPANVVVKLETTKGNYEILIGDYNQIEKTYYIKVSNSDSVYLVEPESKLNYAFNYDTDAFIEGQKK